MSEGHVDDGERAFVPRSKSRDDLAEELGEEAVESMTSGEYVGEDALDRFVPEEVGGPFVMASGRTEFAQGTDPSNPKDATREPFPRT